MKSVLLAPYSIRHHYGLFTFNNKSRAGKVIKLAFLFEALV